MPRRVPGAGASPPPTAYFLPDTLHFPAGASPLVRELWAPAAAAGLDEAGAACGLLLEKPRYAWHTQPPRWQWPATAALGGATLAWRLLTRPDWRARLRGAAGAPNLLRQDALWWHARGRAALTVRHAELAAVVPAGLDDRALATHLAAVTAQYATAARTAVRLYTGALLTLGAWLRMGAAQLRAEPAALLAALPPPPPAFDRDTARALLDPATRQTQPADPLWGVRLLDGVDPAGLTLEEDLPLAASLATACTGPPHVDWRDLAHALLDTAPPRHFRALRDAWEAACTLREAHLDALRAGPATAGGLVRSALLEAQRRLHARAGGAVLAAEPSVFALPADAVVSALAGGPLPQPLPAASAPPATRVGNADTWVDLPPAARERMLDLNAGLAAWLGVPHTREPAAPGGGVQAPGEGGRVRGALVQATTASAVWRAPAGSVLLCNAWPATLGTLPDGLAAVVTRHGGPAALAAGAARAGGVPCVWGVGAALDGWPAGSLVEVDGEAGRVSPVHAPKATGRDHAHD